MMNAALLHAVSCYADAVVRDAGSTSRRIGFVYGEARIHRQPIFAEQASRKVGYVEHDNRGIWFCDAGGKRVARILRYKPHQAPQPSVNASGAFYVPPSPQ